MGTLCAFGAGTLFGVWVDPSTPSAGLGPSDETSTVVVGTDLGADLGSLSTRPSRERRKRADSRHPVALEIPAIDVSTPLMRLGLAPDHTVEVPTDADLAGWYRRGTPPGQAGSAVILGHVDSVDGPAVFARLGELQPGDSVQVSRADGSVVTFVVLKSATYLNADFPARRVYAAQGLRRLNLVTCGGDYDADRGGYQSNLVVYTRLARSGHTG